MTLQENTKVYRLRNLPGHVDRQSAAELFASCFDDASPQHVLISSLAPAIDPWTRSPTKTATLIFKETPTAVHSHAISGEWRFPVPGLTKALILDHHFQGLTPLNEVNPGEHEHE
jgi:hypothetical protein